MPKTKETQRLVLLDAHAILHRAYHALPDFTSDSGEPTGALWGFVSMILKMAQDLSPDYVMACFDRPEATHRKEAFRDYKGTRAQIDEALVRQLNRARDVCEALAIPVYDKPGFEADDMLGTLCERLKHKQDLAIIIVTGDMDTLQLVDDAARVRVYTLKKGIKETVLYDEAKVRERYGFGPEHVADFKGLSGDASDNIPGVPGIGEKTATALIEAFGSIERLYETLKEDEAALLKAGVKPRVISLLREHEDEAHFSKALATIVRDVPVQVALPGKPWREALVPERTRALFRELGFRTLADRAERVFGWQERGVFGEAASSHSAASTPEAALSPQDEAELCVMLWLLNSEATGATLEDVFQWAHTRSPAEARVRLVHELHEAGLGRVFETIEAPLMPVVRAMEESGVRIDVPYLEALAKEYTQALRALESRIVEHAGVVFNINSPKQLGDVLFDELGLSAPGLKKTAGGARSTRESELEKLRDTHPIIEAILEYREIGKLLSTYVEVLPGLADAQGRVHAHFSQTGTTTGRMSSQNPNLQNIPVRTERGRAIRRAFTAREGFVLVALDYSQIELRIAAFLSGDEKLIEVFKTGGDVHRTVAAEVFNVPPEQVDTEMRRRAKIINFGILYGMGVTALQQNLGGTRTEAQEFLSAYIARFPGIRTYLDTIKTEVALKGETRTFFGRRRLFAGIRSPLPYVRAAAERMAINAPIQGTSADIIKLAMVRIAAYVKQAGLEDAVYLVLQVHDELVFEISKEHLARMLPALIDSMESVLTLEETKGVPLRVEGKTGSNWEEMKAWAFY